jgi:hypothetical protein
MFVRNGKTQDCWSVVENKRVAGGRVVQRRVLAEGNELYVYLAQPDGRNKPERRPLVGGRQGYNPWPRLLIVLLNTSAPVLERFARDHDGGPASVPRLLRQQEVETQMHADKKG